MLKHTTREKFKETASKTQQTQESDKEHRKRERGRERERERERGREREREGERERPGGATRAQCAVMADQLTANVSPCRSSIGSTAHKPHGPRPCETDIE